MTRNKRCALSLRCDGDDEQVSLVVRRRERVCTVFMKRLIRIIPPQTVKEGGRETRPDRVTARERAASG